MIPSGALHGSVRPQLNKRTKNCENSLNVLLPKRKYNHKQVLVVPPFASFMSAPLKQSGNFYCFAF